MKSKDHFIPISKTGTGGENILQCCFECNTWKSDRMPEYWLDHVEYCKNRRKKIGTYSITDYSQIIGSLRHWIKFFAGKQISDYKY